MSFVTNSLLFIPRLINTFILIDRARNICITNYQNQLNLIMKIDQYENPNQLQIYQ
jgi:hypothetical protein